MSKNIFVLLFSFFYLANLAAQPTYAIIDAEKKFKEAKDLFLRGQYALAFPLLQDLRNEYPANTTSNYTYLHEDVQYYYIVCNLKLQQPSAETAASNYIHEVSNPARVQLMSYHLARYYFARKDFKNAIVYYENAGLDNLNNDDIADAKFESAYAYFNLKQFATAKPLFNEIHQLPGNKYYMPANYYYGFISYYDKQYNEALQAFTVVENHNDYSNIVPYYIAEINYFRGRKDEALQYAENILNGTPGLYYDKQLKLLTGQIYFEKRAFKKALPLLENYANTTDKVDKKIIYELSYCYYENNQLNKAIEGFKQLSNEKDSMGQNSMYLLGDCYLKTGQKLNARNAFQFCAFSNTNALQQKVSKFNYAKLSYELGFEDVALNEIKKYLTDQAGSEYDAEAKEILVSLLTHTNNFTDALVVYESLPVPTTSMQKVYPKIVYGRAVEYINEQQITKANELLDIVLANKDAAEIIISYAKFWKGEIAYRLFKYDIAIPYLLAFINSKIEPQGEANLTTATYNLAYCWFQKGNYTQALTYFEQIGNDFKANSLFIQQDAYLRSADCYFMKKDFVKAGNMYDNAVSKNFQQSDHAMFQKAMIAGIKNPTEKIKLLNNLISQYPQSLLVQDANIEIANTFMAEEKFADAILYLNKFIASAGMGLLPNAYLQLGLCYYNIDKNKEALESYQLLLQKYPASHEADIAMDNIKTIYVEEGRPNEYVLLMKSYGKTISIAEADSLSYTTAALKYNSNDCTTARQAFDDYLSSYPNGNYTIEANFFKSECYSKNKDWANALSGYDYVFNKGVSPYFEKATIAAARITYFELKNYAKAKQYFEALQKSAVSSEIQLEAVRGLVRCYYLLKDYAQANAVSQELLYNKNVSTDDKSIAFLVLGKSHQINNDSLAAITAFKSCAAINKSAWGAESRYEIARYQYSAGDIKSAEKSALSVIKETPSYDFWVTKSYILLGDIFMLQKDYFNAKATYESIAKNAAITELKNEAQQKFDAALHEENIHSKIND